MAGRPGRFHGVEAAAGVRQGGAGGEVLTVAADLASELQGDAEVVAAADDATKAYARGRRARGALGPEASRRFAEVQAAVERADCLRAPSALRPVQARVSGLTMAEGVLRCASVRRPRRATSAQRWRVPSPLLQL
jgi:hypothetical protein